MVTTRNVDYTAHWYCDSLLIQSTSGSFCGPASYHTDYGVESIMWELHALFLTVYKPITDRCELKDSCRRRHSCDIPPSFLPGAYERQSRFAHSANNKTSKPIYTNKTNLSLVNQQERGFG